MILKCDTEISPGVLYDDSFDKYESLLSSTVENNASPSVVVNKQMRFISLSAQYIANVYAGHSLSLPNVCIGLSIICFIGLLLGLIMPKDLDLPTSWYRNVSAMIGYIYFMCWSVSFYPQLITNYQRKSVKGISTDSYVMLFINNLCYAIYNVFLYWDDGIRTEYKHRHGPNSSITIQSNDVAFSIHGFFLSMILVIQIYYYRGYTIKPLSCTTITLASATILLCGLYIVGILLQYSQFSWFDWLYILAFIKLTLTIAFYLPQIYLNRKRKSTEGYNLWFVILDFLGGFLSLMLLFLDSFDMEKLGDITDNWVKLILGVISIVFDGVFFFQHFVLYEQRDSVDVDHDYLLLDNQIN